MAQHPMTRPTVEDMVEYLTLQDRSELPDALRRMTETWGGAMVMRALVTIAKQYHDPELQMEFLESTSAVWMKDSK